MPTIVSRSGRIPLIVHLAVAASVGSIEVTIFPKLPTIPVTESAPDDGERRLSVDQDRSGPRQRLGAGGRGGREAECGSHADHGCRPACPLYASVRDAGHS